MAEVNDDRFKKSFVQHYLMFIDFCIDAVFCFYFSIFYLWFELLKLFYHPKKNVAGKLVLITGAGAGLGKSLANKLADLGCDLAIADINLIAAQEFVADLLKKGVRAKCFKVDIAKLDEIRKLKENVAREMGHVDILINNAGLVPDMTTDAKPGFFEAMVNVNVLGTIWMTRVFLEPMKQRGGHIVAISSMAGLHSSPYAVPYSATKGAINSYMSGLREKLRLERFHGKIKLTCICPYYITTRSDIAEFLNKNIRFPPLQIDKASEKIVDAILRNDTFVTIPSYYHAGVRFMNLFPLTIQQLVRDRILKEYDFKNQQPAKS